MNETPLWASESLWKKTAIWVTAGSFLILVVLTMDSLSQTSAGSKRVPAYNVINKKIDYQYNKKRRRAAQGAVMTTDLRCYGDDIQGVADLVPDFDLRSAMDVESWYPREWQAIADTLGFAQQLAAAPRAMPTTPDRITAMTLVGLMASEHALRAGRPGVPESQARVQSAVIQAMTATGLERGELWRVTADPTTLATGACYAEGGRSLRALYPYTAPGYFGDGWAGPPPRAESACGWQTPLVLHLGTFPWVYSSRLGDVGPGVRWASPASQPALEITHWIFWPTR